MMKIWQIAVVSTTLGFALPAVAQMAAKAELRSDVEANVKARLGKFDANGDGVVTRDEMKAFADAHRKLRADAEFAAMDTNKDGSISRAEFDAFHAASGHDRMAMMDGDDMPPPPPGPPPAGDAPPPPPPPGGMGGMRAMHEGPGGMFIKPGSDRVVIADAVKQALARFDAMDSNKDGKISAGERDAARAAWRTAHPMPPQS